MKFYQKSYEFLVIIFQTWVIILKVKQCLTSDQEDWKVRRDGHALWVIEVILVRLHAHDKFMTQLSYKACA